MGRRPSATMGLMKATVSEGMGQRGEAGQGCPALTTGSDGQKSKGPVVSHPQS